MSNSINLLPQRKKRESEYIKMIRLSMRVGSVLVSSLFVFFLFIFLCQRVIRIEKEAMEREIDKFRSNKFYSSVIDDQEYIKELYSKKKIIQKRIGDKKKMNTIINQVNGIIPEKVVLSELSLKENEDGKKLDLLLRGEAENREVVVLLKNNLESEELFEEIEAPISNFVSNEDVSFEFKAKVEVNK
jgi:Tfp pilus assembly protein PilN